MPVVPDRSAPDPRTGEPSDPERPERPRLPQSRPHEVYGSMVLLLGALAAMVCAMVPVGPHWLGPAGSVAVATVYSWGLAARTGGRPWIFGALALVIAVGIVLTDDDRLHTGAAVVMSSLSAVFAVMATVPAVTVLRAVRECVIALALAAVGALATVGFEPAIDVDRFSYVSSGLALVAAIVLVYRLGAGLHGLGRRGVVVVIVGTVLLVGTLTYAELLRRYGATGLGDWIDRRVAWNRDHLGASPRPLEALIGVPALLYGTHMRARRRQGWWVCAFGVAATSAVANALTLPDTPRHEAALAVGYGLVVGLVLGYLVIRLDLFLTGGKRGSRGTRSRGRRSRVDEEATAIRPEPVRTAPLL